MKPNEANRLRAEYVEDLLTSLVVAVDREVRRIAHRIAQTFGG